MIASNYKKRPGLKWTVFFSRKLRNIKECTMAFKLCIVGQEKVKTVGGVPFSPNRSTGIRTYSLLEPWSKPCRMMYEKHNSAGKTMAHSNHWNWINAEEFSKLTCYIDRFSCSFTSINYWQITAAMKLKSSAEYLYCFRTMPSKFLWMPLLGEQVLVLRLRLIMAKLRNY